MGLTAMDRDVGPVDISKMGNGNCCSLRPRKRACNPVFREVNKDNRQCLILLRLFLDIGPVPDVGPV